MAKLIDINCDMGEVSDTWMSGRDKELLNYISSINISCDAHAGDVYLIKDTVQEAIALGIKIGAHPSYPDRKNFGRIKMSFSKTELAIVIQEQVLFLKEMVESSGGLLHHVKPHGALYNVAALDESISELMCETISLIDSSLILFCLSGSIGSVVSVKSGLKIWQEAFVDRAYQKDGSLRPRKEEGALIYEPEMCLEQFRMIKKGKIETYEGGFLKLDADTVCIHGDGPNAVSIAKLLHEEQTRLLI